MYERCTLPTRVYERCTLPTQVPERCIRPTRVPERCIIPTRDTQRCTLPTRDTQRCTLPTREHKKAYYPPGSIRRRTTHPVPQGVHYPPGYLKVYITHPGSMLGREVSHPGSMLGREVCRLWYPGGMVDMPAMVPGWYGRYISLYAPRVGMVGIQAPYYGPPYAPGYTVHIQQSQVVTASSWCRPWCVRDNTLGSRKRITVGGRVSPVLKS